MSSSAINTQVAQLKIGNVQNQADSSAVYSGGVWSLKNSTAVASVTISDAGKVGIGMGSTSYPLTVKTDTDFCIGLTTTSAGTGARILAANLAADVYKDLTVDGSVLQFSTIGTERMRINASGYVLVGKTTAPDGTFHVRSLNTGARAVGVEVLVTSNFEAMSFRNPNGVVGSINTNGSNTAFNTSSDYRLKEDVKPMVAALSKVAALKPCTYKWKVDGSEGEGFIAHELQEVCPLAVSGEKDAVNEDGSIKTQGIDPSKLVGLLVAAIQELEARLAALESK